MICSPYSALLIKDHASLIFFFQCLPGGIMIKSFAYILLHRDITIAIAVSTPSTQPIKIFFIYLFFFSIWLCSCSTRSSLYNLLSNSIPCLRPMTSNSLLFSTINLALLTGLGFDVKMFLIQSNIIYSYNLYCNYYNMIAQNKKGPCGPFLPNIKLISFRIVTWSLTWLEYPMKLKSNMCHLVDAICECKLMYHLLCRLRHHQHHL